MISGPAGERLPLTAVDYFLAAADFFLVTPEDDLFFVTLFLVTVFLAAVFLVAVFLVGVFVDAAFFVALEAAAIQLRPWTRKGEIIKLHKTHSSCM